jgi:hypothetical protein
MRGLVLFTLLVSSLGAVASASSSRSGNELFYCGGETTNAEVASYFEKLEKALSENGPKNRFNQFVADRFGVTDSGGRTLRFALKDFNSITPGRITIGDWERIRDRGPARLEGAGWRGCFMDHGKVWFEADGQSGLKLKLIARDIDWVDPHGG